MEKNKLGEKKNNAHSLLNCPNYELIIFFYILLSSSEHEVTMFHYSSPHFSVEETETHRSEFSRGSPVSRC